MGSAARNLPKFLRPAGEIVSVATAYQIPLQHAKVAGTAVVSSVMLLGLFLSYLAAPIGVVLAGFALRKGASRGFRLFTGISLGYLALDQVAPMPKQSLPQVRWLLPLLKKVTEAFEHRFYPDRDLTKTFKQDRPYLLAVTPHGFFPWGAALVMAELFEQGYLPNLVGASILGALPIAGRVLRTFGYYPATKENIAMCLAKPYPRNITVIVPGGIAEMFCIREDIEVSATSLRTGFVEQAMQADAVLVPGYMLGSSKLYDVGKGALGGYFEWLSRKLRMSVNMFHGRWGTPLPYPHRLACALGEPIDTREFSSVEVIHKLFMTRIRETYNKHKGIFGWSDRELYFEGEEMPKPPLDPFAEYSELGLYSKL